MNIKIKQLFSISFVLLLLLCIGSSAFALTQTEATKIFASDWANTANFGHPVVVYGNIALIGAHKDDDNGYDSGSVYVFTRDAAGVWTETAKLIASDGAPYDWFGYSIAISGKSLLGTTVLVGAYRDDDNGVNSGSAYVFRQDATGAWTEVAKLIASDGVADNQFGKSVAISGYTALVGAHRNDNVGLFSGAVYAFGSDPWGNWTEEAKLTASDGLAYDNFGFSVALSGDNTDRSLYGGTAAIGAQGDNSPFASTGSTYIFTRDASGVWAETAKLYPFGGAITSHAGSSVALSDSGDTMISGSPADYVNGPGSGAVNVYVRDSITGVWSHQAQLTPSDPATGDFFGHSVGLSPSGDAVVVGAFGDDDADEQTGSAYLFARDGDEVWTEQSKLVASDGATFDYFGFRVAISGDTAFVGSPLHEEVGYYNVGTAYTYPVEASEPRAAAICIAPPTGMVAWWRGEGDAADIFGTSDGTLANGATFAAGAVGDAFAFDGVDDYVIAPSIAPLITTNQITIQAWVKPGAYNNAAWCCAHIVGLDSAAGWGTHLAMGPSTPYLWSNNGIRVRDSEPLFLSTWQHIAATYDGTTARLYKNGVLTDTHNIAVSFPLGDATMIGASNTVQLRQFSGLIDEVEIYSRALTASEIVDTYNAGDKGHCNGQPPVAVAGADQSVHQGMTVNLDGTGSTDPDGDPLTYLWEIISSPSGSAAVLSDDTAATPTFVVDLGGDYVARLIVTDSTDASSAPDEVTISTYNTAPVAAAGPDQAIILAGSTVQLDGTQSYDDDGDAITHLWVFKTKPQTSVAFISDPYAVSPTFVADVYGDYHVRLVVSDPWVSSAADYMVVSFSNVRPVADSGGNQSAVVGDFVYLNGLGSTDANGDPLGYRWFWASRPTGSTAYLADARTEQASFRADWPGTYVVVLLVNDGLITSAPSTASIEVLTYRVAAQKVLRAAQIRLRELRTLQKPPIKNVNLIKSLNLKINSVLRMVGRGGLSVTEAINKLSNDLLTKTDGCARTGSPDKNDWITTCDEQARLYNRIKEAIGYLKSLP